LDAAPPEHCPLFAGLTAIECAAMVPSLPAGPRTVRQRPMTSAAELAFARLLYVVALPVVTGTDFGAVDPAAPVWTTKPVPLVDRTLPEVPADALREGAGWAKDPDPAPALLRRRFGLPPRTPAQDPFTAGVIATEVAAPATPEPLAPPLRTSTHEPTVTSDSLAGTVSVKVVPELYVTAVWLPGLCTCSV